MLKKDLYELTTPQKNIWQLELVSNSQSSINHIFAIMKLKGCLNEDLLTKTINIIIEKNDSFRIKFFKKNSSIFQYIEDYSYTPIEIKYSNIDDINDIIENYKKSKITFDKLFCFCLVFTPNYTFVLYKSHHIIADGWGMTQVAEQIKEIYTKLLNGEDLSSYKKISYLSLIEREKKYFNSEKYNIDEQFWDNYVSLLSPSKLFNSSDIFEKKAVRFNQTINNSLFNRISAYCEKNKITEYSFFLGILSVYFSKIYNLNSIIFGTPFLNRQKRLGELESTGMYISTLPLNINIDYNDSFSGLCKKIGVSNLSLYKHSNFPYHKIQELYYKKTNDNSTLYDIGFSYQINKLENNLSNNDHGECQWLFLGEQNNPLTIHISTLNGYKLLSYDYLISCFTEKEIKKMKDVMFNLIHEVLEGNEKISELSLLTPEDISKFKKFNNTGTINCQNTIIDLFNDVVSKYANNTAIVCGNKSISYSQLNEKITNVSKMLLNLGLSQNTPVALIFDKSIEMISAMFGVLKAGGCYVPILPDENTDRIDYILNDCKPKCILTHKSYDKTISTQIPIINLDSLETVCSNITFPKLSNENIAYIIYTSGSTGNPKGTMVTHKNISNLKNSIENDSILKATNKDISISLLKYSFDASGIDIYTSLLFGGKLLLVEKDIELNPEKVIKLMEKEKVTRSFLIPKWIEHIAIQNKLLDADLSNLKILGTGGETLKPYILDNLIAKYPNLKILNLYGPTETTMFTTLKVVSNYEISNNHTSIGNPIFGARVGIVNSNLEFLPLNTKGELIIYEDDTSIKNIAKGYLNLEDQTKNKFVSLYNPILKKKVSAYRTGDIAFINDNLEIEFLGRNDDVVKVNGGYLVALNEVQNKIQKLLGNNFEVYPVSVPYKNTKVIILFLTKKEKNITLYNIKNHINNNISFYMKPKKIIELEDFPRNSSGKIDRKKLIYLATEYMKNNKNKIISPRTKTEKDIYNYIKQLIKTEDFSITDDFIDDLGIDSLSLTAIYTYLEKYNINIQDLYNNPTIKDLAYYIDNNFSCSLKPDLTNIENIKILNNVKPFNLENVLITGVTGFLGIHLLKDLLLNKTVKKIYCIIRNKINLNGKERLLKLFDYYFNSDEYLINLLNYKVIILNGDVTKENLGLDNKIYDFISNNITTIINSAANVRHFVKPQQIKKDNVQSVKNLIQLCKNNISLAHISTLSIAGFKNNFTENKIFDENTLFINQDFNNNPYLISKFEAEKIILEETYNNNLNTIIFRLGNIMPRYNDGVFQINANQNVFLSSLKAIIESKVLAKDFLDLKLEFSPVDECSKNILGLLTSNNSNSIYHILSDKEVTVNELKTLLNSLNCDIINVDLKTFINKLDKFADEYTKEYITSNNLNSYSEDITINCLKKLNLKWSNIDANYMQKILDILQNF